jgi:hypothetical protein
MLSIRTIVVTYLVYIVLLFFFTLMAVAVVGLESRFLARLLPLSGNQLLVLIGVTGGLITFFSMRIGLGVRSFLAVLILFVPVLSGGFLGIAWILQRISPLFDLWTATLLVLGTGIAIILGFSQYFAEFEPPFLEELEEEGEWEEEEEEEEWEEEEEYLPPRATRFPRLSAVKRSTARESDEDKWANVGRNDPCPCGSGKKYKHCHGRPRKQRQL